MSKPVNSNKDFEELVTKAEKLVLVDFWAPWCGPCRVVSPILDEIAHEHSDQVEVVKVNVDEQQDLAARYGVMSIPTLILFKDGNVVDQTIGSSSKGKLVNWINSALDKEK